MNKAAGLIKFVFENFGPLLVFYTANHLWGLRTAVLSTLIFTVIEVARKLRKKESLTSFFIYSIGITTVCGVVDLYLNQSILFKYEASLTNTLTAIFFGASIFSKKSLIQEFAEHGNNVKSVTSDLVFYFKLLTGVWTIYFVAKAGIYFWISSRYSLEESLVMRGAIGNLSFYALLSISIFGSRPIIRVLRSWKLLPAKRAIAL